MNHRGTVLIVCKIENKDRSSPREDLYADNSYVQNMFHKNKKIKVDEQIDKITIINDKIKKNKEKKNKAKKIEEEEVIGDEEHLKDLPNFKLVVEILVKLNKLTTDGSVECMLQDCGRILKQKTGFYNHLYLLF